MNRFAAVLKPLQQLRQSQQYGESRWYFNTSDCAHVIPLNLAIHVGEYSRRWAE
jgi:hypothetical protein